MLGNEKEIELLRRQAAEGNLSHAYLIIGEVGMGKKTLARLIGLEVFCNNKQERKACLVCPECKKVLSDNHPDMIWVRHEKPQVVSVDDIRTQVCEEALIRPFHGGKKIIVIDDADKMNVQAQNALLKTLEEPPEYLMILLLCRDEHALTDTIRSRCVQIKLQRVNAACIRDFLVMDLHTENEKAETAATFAAGNPGRAIALASGEEFQSVYLRTVELCKNVRTMDAAAISTAAKQICEDDPELTLELMEDWIRDVVCCRVGGDTTELSFRAELSAIRKQAASLDIQKASRLLEQLRLANRRLGANVNRELTWNLLLLEMREL